MKKFAMFVLAVSAPLAALSAQPETSTPEPTQQAESSSETAAPAEDRARRTPPGERRICRRIDTTGSRTGGQRVCMTAAEWRRAEY